MLINNYIIFIYKLIFKTNKTIKNFFSLYMDFSIVLDIFHLFKIKKFLINNLFYNI